MHNYCPPCGVKPPGEKQKKKRRQPHKDNCFLSCLFVCFLLFHIHTKKKKNPTNLYCVVKAKCTKVYTFSQNYVLILTDSATHCLFSTLGTTLKEIMDSYTS